jgi:outer membrane murein-binding lipoprotein Lpp
MTSPGRHAYASLLCACILLVTVAARAQDTHGQESQTQPPATEQPANESSPDPFGAIRRWFNNSVSKFNSDVGDAQSRVDQFNHDAGTAARSTADAAKDAADAVARLPNARVMSGHETCTVSANGAPNCLAAATALCKGKGFGSGKSVDMTTAEECPAQVLLRQRTASPGECKTVTFVSRALCQP